MTWTTEQTERYAYGNFKSDEISVRISPLYSDCDSLDMYSRLTGNLYPDRLKKLIEEQGEKGAAVVIGMGIIEAMNKREELVKEHIKKHNANT